MNKKKEKEIEKNSDRFVKRVYKSLLLTVAIVFLSFYTFGFVMTLISGSSGDTPVILSSVMGCILTVLICTFTILDEIKKLK